MSELLLVVAAIFILVGVSSPPVPPPKPPVNIFTYYMLPPPEYDKPYPNMNIFHLEFEHLQNVCSADGKYPAPDGYEFSGCASLLNDNKGTCNVFVVTKEKAKERGIDYDMLIRHEQGHCNGWVHK